MSVEKIAAVLHHAPIGGTAKLLLIGIANHEGDGGAWPAMSTLARYAGVTERNAQKMMRRLTEQGMVELVEREGYTSLYRTLIECPAGCDRTTSHRLTPVASDTPVAFDTPVGSDTPPGVGSDTPPLSPATPEPSYNRHMNQTIHTLSVQSTFQTFIERYPRKSDKQNAWASWSKMTLSDALKALDGLDRWKASEEYPKEARYIPYAANWVDRQYWAHEYTPKKKSETVADRAQRIRNTNTPTTTEECTTELVECSHGLTGFCRECYTQQAKENHG
jgi:Helix-turn-helix domain